MINGEEKCGNEDQVVLSCWLYRKKQDRAAVSLNTYVKRYATIKETLVLDIHCDISTNLALILRDVFPFFQGNVMSLHEDKTCSKVTVQFPPHRMV